MPAFLGIEIFHGDPTPRAAHATTTLTGKLTPLSFANRSGGGTLTADNTTAHNGSTIYLSTHGIPSHVAPTDHVGPADHVGELEAEALLRLYNDGVRANSLGMMLASALTLVLAPLLPLLARPGR